MKHPSPSVLVVVALGLVSCSRATESAPSAVARSPLARGDDPALVGLSGLGARSDGALTAVPERRRELLWLEAAAGRLRVTRHLPINGIPEGLDTEALAWWSPTEVVFGTESQVPERASDPLLWARLEGEQVVVSERIELPYALWRTRAAVNRGVEGLCAAGGKLVLAIEHVLEDDGRRYGLIATYDPLAKSWAAFRLRLTSDKGKLSSAECRVTPTGELEVFVIERHYEVVRLLSFTLMAGAVSGDLEPTLRRDLALRDRVTGNIEGLAWTTSGGLRLLTDNDSGGVTGPAQLFELSPADL